jgi:hypothetical protein
MNPGSRHLCFSRTGLRPGLRCTSIAILSGLVLSFGTSDDAEAQLRPAVLQLLVIDAGTSRPIVGAQVIVDGGREVVQSGSDGMVELTAAEGDSLVLELRMVGYGNRALTATPTTGIPLLVTVPLELAPIILAPVRVEVESGPRTRALREFYERARRGAGQYLTRAEIDRRQPRDLSDLFRMLPGITLSAGTFGDRPEMEAKGSMLQEPGSSECSLQYFLDGTPINPPEGAIGFDVELSEVEGIEIYRRGTGVPARFQRQHGSCGVILIWKREALDG